MKLENTYCTDILVASFNKKGVQSIEKVSACSTVICI